MSYIYTKAYSQYGASMGRRDNVAEALDVKKLHLERVRLNSGGYDPGGAYWGQGAPMEYMASLTILSPRPSTGCDSSMPAESHASWNAALAL